MKKLMTLALATTLACTAPLALVACGTQGGTDGTAATSQTASSEFATLGDVLSADTESMMATYDESRYACAFFYDGAWWHVEAALDDGMSKKIDETWVEDQTKLEELLSPLTVTLAEKLDAPSDEEVAANVGKTGADLVADGFEFLPYCLVVNGSATDATVTQGSFEYLITFDGVVDDENTEDPAGAVANMTVTDAVLQGVAWSVLDM